MTKLYDLIPGIRYTQLKLNQLWSYIPPPPPPPQSSSTVSEEKVYKILVVQSHPCPESYNAVIAQTFVESAIKLGHDVRRITLYDNNDATKCYRPNMNRFERDNYFALLNPNEQQHPKFELASEVKHHIELLQWCDTLVFIYPTWWMNTPATLKGFLDRTFLPGPTWDFPSSSSNSTTTTTATAAAATAASLGLVPKLNNIQRMIGISTYGANNTTVFLAGDNGRRMISNAIRHSVCPNASVLWLGLYGVDTASLQQRQEFLQKVAKLPSSEYF
jgi:NAD(P)H dehydrogenase (quinone)